MLSKESGKSLENFVLKIRKLLLENIQDSNESKYSFYLKGKERETLTLSEETRTSYEALLAYSRQITGNLKLEDPKESVLESLYLEKAYSIANRFFLLKRLEESKVQRLPVFSGEASPGYTQFREFFPALCSGEDNGFDFLFRQFSDYYASELPTLFGENKILRFIVYKPGVILELVRLSSPVSRGSGGIWQDDTTLGWVYQYWNDPDRTKVNKKVSGSGTDKGKIEKHEIPYVTQLFTERYMVEWLLQNSLGVKWLALCQKNAWTPLADSVVKNLEERRTLWKQKLQSGEVSSDATMPIESREEHFWKYYIPAEIPQSVVEDSPTSVYDLKVFDPANGSGHFLLYALRLFFEFAKEEASFRGEEFRPEIALKRILEDCLYGVDIDNRAIQLASASLYITAKEILIGEELDPNLLELDRLNLVATNFSIGKLSQNSEEVLLFKKELKEKTGLSEAFVDKLFINLQQADSLGSLLQISEEIRTEIASEKINKPLFYSPVSAGMDVLHHTHVSEPRHIVDQVYNLIDKFVSEHDTVDDIGIQNMAKQLGRGLRLLQILDGQYDVVVTNPPYLGLSKMNSAVQSIIESNFPEGKADLYATFFLIYQKFAKPNAIISTVTMHGWMFLTQFLALRKRILENHTLYKCSHLGSGAFDAISGEVTAVGMFIFINKIPDDKDISNFQRLVNISGSTQKDSMMICPLEKYQFQTPQNSFHDIPGSPMIYWWTEEFRDKYKEAEKVGGEVYHGNCTNNNARFLKYIWELKFRNINLVKQEEKKIDLENWIPYIKGAQNTRWIDSCDNLIKWYYNAKELKISVMQKYGSYTKHVSPISKFFQQGIAFSYIGTNDFLCRLRKYKSIFDVSGSSIFIENPEKVQVSLSSKLSGYVSQSINPTINNQVGDIQHLPIFPVKNWESYFNRAKELYDLYFASKETCIEFQYPTYISEEEFQAKEVLIRSDIDREVYKNFSEETIKAIQEEVGMSPGFYPKQSEYDKDRLAYFADVYLNGPYKFQLGEILLKGDGTPERGGLQDIEALCHEFRLHPDSILELKNQLDLERHGDKQQKSYYHLAFALGVLLGRFDKETGHIIGVEKEIKPKKQDNILYFSTLGDLRIAIERETKNTDDLAVEEIKAIISEKNPNHAEQIRKEMEKNLLYKEDGKRQYSDLNEFMRLGAFSYHKSIYSNRPIYFPLSSRKKNFVVWTCIHTWAEDTITKILADYVEPDLKKLKNRLESLTGQYTQTNLTNLEKNTLAKDMKNSEALINELEEFTDTLKQVYEKGPKPQKQERLTTFKMDLDDGVMVNSAALHSLLTPQWKEPEKWWGYLENPKGKHDFDWSHLAMRYYPNRVFEKVKKDPSLAVAHSDYGEYKGRDLLAELHPKYAEKWKEIEDKNDTPKEAKKTTSNKKRSKKQDSNQRELGLQ